jgi:hypothetical protein
MALQIEPYSDSSFVVRGDTRPYLELFTKQMHGKWNPNLKGGGAMIFSNTHLDSVQSVVAQINAGQPISVPAQQSYKYTPKVQQVNALPGASFNILPIKSKSQTLTYKVYLPEVGERVIIDVDNGVGVPDKLETTVRDLQPGNDIIHLIYKVDPNLIFEAGVYAGKWQVKGEIRPHILIFG